MLKMGIAQPSASPWSSPLYLVPKKSGYSRLCRDYRCLKDRFWLKSFWKIYIFYYRSRQSIQSNTSSWKWYLKNCKNNSFRVTWIPIHDVWSQKCCTNISEIYRRSNTWSPYIDDILVASADAQEHLKNLKIIFQRLEDYSLVINIAKSTFGHSEAEFLVHHITNRGIKPLPEKVSAIRNLSPPTTDDEFLPQIYKKCGRTARTI